jgi:undecaprenyl diphosphate synthase
MPSTLDISSLNPKTVSLSQMNEIVKTSGIKHIAMIMDGNRRWAKEHFLPTAAGHAQGVSALKKIVTHADDIGLQVLTVYAFSTENWNRDQEEVGALMKLILQALSRELDELHAKGVQLKFIGDLSPFSSELKALLEASMEKTRNNTKLVFQVAINYGSRAELARCARLIAEEVQQGLLDPAVITEETLAQRLYTAHMPDPDLLIRTGGEYRLSNYLLWQCAYAEFYVTPTLWPSFSPQELNTAIFEFLNRERRFGR